MQQNDSADLGQLDKSAHAYCKAADLNVLGKDMKVHILILISTLIANAVLAEGRAPYDAFLKASLIKKRLEIDGEKYVRMYLKPTERNASSKPDR